MKNTILKRSLSLLSFSLIFCLPIQAQEEGQTPRLEFTQDQYNDLISNSGLPSNLMPALADICAGITSLTPNNFGDNSFGCYTRDGRSPAPGHDVSWENCSSLNLVLRNHQHMTLLFPSNQWSNSFCIREPLAGRVHNFRSMSLQQNIDTDGLTYRIDGLFWGNKALCNLVDSTQPKLEDRFGSSAACKKMILKMKTSHYLTNTAGITNGTQIAITPGQGSQLPAVFKFNSQNPSNFLFNRPQYQNFNPFTSPMTLPEISSEESPI